MLSTSTNNKMENQTSVELFIIVGLSGSQHLQILLFFLFLMVYILTVLGNLLIILSVNIDSALCSPMYYLLSNLSFIDLCYSSVTTPKMLENLLSVTKSIHFNECMIQIFFFHIFGCTECFILAIMAFDRCIAICNPLRYTTIMSRRICNWLVLASWVGGTIHSTVQILLMLTLPFCGPNEIDHIFCDIPPLLKLACTDTSVIEAMFISNSGLIALLSFLVLVGSYTPILFAIRQHSSEGKRKALSTCGAHLIVVTLIFGPCTVLYMRPSTTFPLDKVVAVFYAVITPMLNPLIYTLRNAEVKRAMKKIASKRISILHTISQ